MAPHFILEELGVDFELELVDRKSDQQKSAEYLKLNPAGRIPTLIDNGMALFESPAICLHLAESHIEKGLIPTLGDKDRAQCLQWLMYLTNTLQAELMVYFYPKRHTNQPENAEAIGVAQEQRVIDCLALIDEQLATRPYLAGDTISVCDFFLFMLAVWSDEMKKPPLAFEHLGKYLKRLAQLKSIKTVCEKENLSLADYQ